MKEIITYISNHRRPVSAALSDMATALMLGASIGCASRAVPHSSQFWVAVMFAISFIGITLLIRSLWSLCFRRLDRWNRNRYICYYQPIEPDADSYAAQFILCYGMIIVVFFALIFITQTQEQLINTYVVGTMIFVVAAIFALCVGIRRLYEYYRSL